MLKLSLPESNKRKSSSILLLPRKVKLRIRVSGENTYLLFNLEMASDNRWCDSLHNDVIRWRWCSGCRWSWRSPLILYVLKARYSKNIFMHVECARWYINSVVFDMIFKLRGRFQNTLINRIIF